MLDGSGGWGHGDIPGLRLAPGTVVAGFTIEGLLASGSFGTVYRAKRDGRPFAIKLVSLAPRGNREADALRRMQHPNVVGFHGFGFWPDEQPRFLVLALELVEGLPLDVWMQQVNPTALELVGRVMLPVALTLADVHAAGVVHRDLKEANILMRDSDGLPVLVDFGAAGLEGAPRLTQWLPPGTPEYRSPETLRQAREWEGEPYQIGPAEDLWALGVVAYILLTRTLPFGDRNEPGMVRAILEKTPPAPHELNPRVPPALSELCMQMLEKNPEDRYADARELAEALSTEWAQADKSWRVRLFPEARREENPAPAPPPAPAVPPENLAPKRRKWPRTGLILATAIVGGVVTPFIQRRESPPPAPPQKAVTRQELAPPQVTGEVGNGAGLQKSPTPAPVASATSSEEPKTMNSQKLRSLAATTLLGSATCVGAGCVSAPQHRPPPEDCPPEALASHKKLGLKHGNYRGVFLPAYSPERHPDAVVSEGDTMVLLFSSLKGLPADAQLLGRFYFAKNHVYGRFTQARLANGEIVPVCMQLTTSRGLGIAMAPGSTPKKTLVPNLMSVEAVERFE
ncbi:serine/threonine protein kinase [Archangium lansingense]|uniref:Serine/threonine-protein kinase n=1 Tax=Archangium lansingense TaxID=2995310 RepID=A0ABT4A8M2_9BACT|nr:serine/threonine-protein kinase [Archangium lansinium]MCY1078005.1 serine/threonine-protein kinase [Archangium lansinium]